MEKPKYRQTFAHFNDDKNWQYSIPIKERVSINKIQPLKVSFVIVISLTNKKDFEDLAKKLKLYIGCVVNFRTHKQIQIRKVMVSFVADYIDVDMNSNKSQLDDYRIAVKLVDCTNRPVQYKNYPKKKEKNMMNRL